MYLDVCVMYRDTRNYFTKKMLPCFTPKWLMLLYFVMTTSIVIIDSFVLENSYNILLKGNTEYMIDEAINDEDYEMISNVQQTKFNVDKEDIPYILYKLPSKDYEKQTIGSIKVLHGTEQTVPKIIKKYKESNTLKHKISTLTTYTHSERDNSEDDEADYNYEDLLKEYYETNDYVSSNKTQRTKIKVKSIFYFDPWTRNCTEEELKHIGFKAICCLIQDYKNGESLRVLLARLWRIIKIWTGVYICITVPLWCTRGWCCCCLLCKFFKPRQTINEAKRYFVANPPGVLKEANKKEVLYEPTDNERDAYEEFEHLIRTI